MMTMIVRFLIFGLFTHGAAILRRKQPVAEIAESGGESDFDVEGSVHWDWNYDNPDGWEHHSKECGYDHQSPIDIREDYVTRNETPFFDALNVSYRMLPNARVHNNGHGFQIDGNFGNITLPDGPHDVRQFHMHMPSEHTYEGKHTAGEIHIVHQRRDCAGVWHLGVIAVLLYDIDDQNNESYANIYANDSAMDNATTEGLHKFLRQIGLGSYETSGDQLPLDEGDHRDVGDVDLRALYPVVKGEYWHYYGSLTTPPCSENVHWYVMKQPVPITRWMNLQFREVLGFKNNRPTQPINGRHVKDNQWKVQNEFPDEGKWDNR